MKISDIHQQANTMQQIDQANKSKQADDQLTTRKAKGSSSSTDKVEFSAQSREMQKIYEVLRTTPDVREEKVSALKKAIQEGRYQVENDALADKLIKESILDLIK
jgi:negative regulator of flagellin synthesis FlgM